MNRIKTYFQKKKEKKIVKNERSSKKVVLEELFNDMYDNRVRIYKVNFVRGIMFGAGSVIGGTILIALIVWLLSLLVNVPFVGDTFKNAQQSIEQTTNDTSR